MLRSRWVLLACALIPAGTLAAPNDQNHALRRQIAALQLDHALNLTQQQAQALLPILQDAKGKVQALKAQRAAAQPALTAALTQAVADLKSSGTVSATTVQAVQAARGSAPGTLRQDLKSSWQQAKQILTPDQLQALKSVKLGIGGPASANATGGSGQGGRGARPFARGLRLVHVALSDAFIALVQARAG